MIVNDERKPSDVFNRPYLVVGTDPFMGEWANEIGVHHGSNYAAWACSDEELKACTEYVESRKDLNRVRVVLSAGYMPKCGHLTIYVFNKELHKVKYN